MPIPYKLNYFEIETGIDSTSTFIHTGDLTATKVKKYLGTSNDILLGDGTTASLSGKQNTITLTTTGSSGAATLIGATLNIPNYGGALSGYVPYTGATQALNLGTNNGILLTDTSSNSSITITSSSTGSGAIVVNKSVNGQGVTVNNAGIGSGIYANNSSTGNGVTIGNASTGKGLVIDNAALAIGDPFVYTLGGAAFVKAKIDYLGNITGNSFVKTGGTSSQFLKADGSIDSTAYGTGSVTSVAALTLGTTGTDLSSTVANGTTTPVITLNVPTASATNRGALSSADWTTFNSKQNTITLTTSGSSGASTFISNTLNVPTYTLSGLGGVPTTRTLTINGTAQDLSADRTFSVGTVTSVGLSMPAAFSVASSPVTGSGTIAVTGAGLASQYIRGDGQLADFPTGGGGGGSSVSYYLNGSVNQGTFVGNTYYEMNKTPVLGTGTDFTINANGYITQFITDANDPNSLLIPGGNWNLEFYFSASSGGGTPSFYAELYKYDGTTFTLIASNSAAPELISFGTSIQPYFSALAVPETVLLATDRLAIRIYVTHSGKTITLHTENSHLCQVITTFTTGLQSLNGLSKQAQFFAVGTLGTDFAISSSVDTHTFNLPTASATNRGALSSANWTTFNSKQDAITLTTTGSSGAATLIGSTLNIPNYGSALSGYVPYTGATQNVVLGAFDLSLSNLAVNNILANNNGLNDIGSLGGNTFRNVYANSFVKTGGTSSQFLKADGSVDSTAYGTGTVTSVAALTLGTSGTDLSSTVANGNTTPVITLNVPTASATNRGALSSGDWTTFNGKQDTITLTTTGTSGAATFIANTLNIPQYQSVLTNPVTGTGTTNYLPKFTSSTAIGDSAITDDGTTVTLVSRALSGTSATFSGLITSTIGVNNYLRASNTSTDGLFIENSNNGNTSYYGINNSTGSLFFTGSTAYSTNIGNASARDFHIGTNGIVRATITSSGNVGIGTTSPATAKLEVFASIPSLFTADSQANTLTYGGSIFYRNHTGAGEGNGIAFNLNNASNNRAEYAYIGGIIQTNTAGSENGAILFATSSSGARTERMRITSGGNVVVGGTTAGTVLSTSITVNNATAANFAGFIPMTANTERGYYAGSSSGLEIGVAGSGTFDIYTGGLIRARITSGGNVLIGTTTDAGYKLDVNGTGRFSGAVTATSVNVVYNNTLTGQTADDVTLATYTAGSSNELLQITITLTNNNATGQVRSTFTYTTDDNDAATLGAIATTPQAAVGEGQAVIALNIKNGTTLTIKSLITVGGINYNCRVAITKIL